MARFIALLRGVNVGGKKKVPMARLRELLLRLGFSEVSTLLQSGNVVFGGRERSTARLARRIEDALREELGFEVPVIVRTRDELAAALERNPLPGAEEDPSRFLVTFLSEGQDAMQLPALDPAAYLPDELRVVGREIYARFPNGIRDSKLAAKLLGRAWA